MVLRKETGRHIDMKCGVCPPGARAFLLVTDHREWFKSQVTDFTFYSITGNWIWPSLFTNNTPVHVSYGFSLLFSEITDLKKKTKTITYYRKRSSSPPSSVSQTYIIFPFIPFKYILSTNG